MGYKSNAQRKAVHASKADGGKGAPSKMYKKKSPAKKPLVGKQKNLPDHLKKKILASPAKMNRYDKDMMDYRKQIAGDKEMIHDIDLKKKKSMAKMYGKKSHAKMKHGDKSMAKMSAELKYMPIVDREKSTMSAMGSHKVLKHMKGRM